MAGQLASVGQLVAFQLPFVQGFRHIADVLGGTFVAPLAVQGGTVQAYLDEIEGESFLVDFAPFPPDYDFAATFHHGGREFRSSFEAGC